MPPPPTSHIQPPIQSSLIPEPYISPFSFKSAQRGHGLILVALSFLQQFLLCLHHQKKRSLCQFHPSLKYLSVFSLFVSINLSQRRYSWRTPTCRSVFSVCKLQYPLFFSSIQLFPFVWQTPLKFYNVRQNLRSELRNKLTTESTQGAIRCSLIGAIKFIGEIRRPIEGPLQSTESNRNTTKSYCPHKQAAIFFHSVHLDIIFWALSERTGRSLHV